MFTIFGESIVCVLLKYSMATKTFRANDLSRIEGRGGSRLMQLMRMHQSEFFELRILKKISMLIVNK